MVIIMRMDTPYKPEEVNYNRDKFDILDKHFQRMIDKKAAFGAAYCMAREGKKFVENSIGTMSYDNKDDRQLRPDAIFWIASITKLFTATAILKLVENGEFRLENSVADLLEEFKKGPFKDINVAALLSHTSGLMPDRGTFINPYFQSPGDYIREGFAKGEENWLENALKSGIRTRPDIEWAYSSFGYLVLGEIISRVSGVFAEDFIQKEIIEPCGMEDTHFKKSLQKKDAERLVIMNHENQELVNKLRSDIEDESSETDKMKSKVPGTEGGLFSTTSDLIKFGNMLMNGGYHGDRRIIGRLTVDRMTIPYTKSHIKDYCWGAGGVERGYGLGPDLRYNPTSLFTKGSYFHEGSGASCLMIDPYEKMVAAWVIPFSDYDWHGEGLYNASTIMWSGIL